MHPSLLGGLTSAEFLERYWQKEPLLVRGAFPDFKDPVTPDELAGLAMEEGVHARLVMEKGGRRPWQVLRAPITERRLRTLPRSHWSLLVSNLNQLVDGGALLLDAFTFLPLWRQDDLMVSFAPSEGSVGPHIDSYDVFLIQGLGRRRWQINRRPDARLVPDLDLKILADFKAEEEWVLEPGDMLYLPPGVAHWGVALESCLTYSVGFRAPASGDLLAGLYNLADPLLGACDVERLYADPDLHPQENPGEISSAALARVEAMVREPLGRPEVLGRWLGAYATSPAPGALPPPQGPRLTRPQLLARLEKNSVVWRTDDVRVAYLQLVPGKAHFYEGGMEHELDLKLLPLIQEICRVRRREGQVLLKSLPRGAKQREMGLDLLRGLVSRGTLYFAKH